MKLLDAAGVIQEIVTALQATPSWLESIWQVVGASGAGKTELISRLFAEMQRKSIPRVLVSAPTRSLDAGAAALLEVAVRLQRYGLEQLDFDLLTNITVPFDDKLRSVRDAITKSDRPVLLVWDEPFEQTRVMYEDDTFDERLLLLRETLFDIPNCRHVCLGFVPSTRPVVESYQLDERSRFDDWFRPARWGTLSDAVVRVRERLGDSPQSVSPLVVQLGVVLAGLDPELVTRRKPVWSCHYLAGCIADQVDKYPDFRPLQKVWAKLALVRRPFGKDLVWKLEADSLAKPMSDVLHYGLLTSWEELITLAYGLRTMPSRRAWLTSDEEQDSHRWLMDYYARQRAKRDGTDSQRFLDEMEGFHHAAAIGSVDAPFEPFFPEQLDSLGRSLSTRYRDYRRATEVFRKVVQYDQKDDYGHYQLAWNCDIRGVERDLVEQHYRRALELDRQNPNYWSGLITFLLTLGRSAVAQGEWPEALDALNLPDPEAPSSLYEQLHLPVLRLLVHHAELEFAESVLATVPKRIIKQHAGLLALRQQVMALKEARDGEALFPLTVSPERWWKRPELLPLFHQEEKLQEWLPGRIEDVSKEEVYLIVGERQSDGTCRYGSVVLSCDEFNRASFDERADQVRGGRFVVLGFYGTARRTVIRVRADQPAHGTKLPPFTMNPNRYLQPGGVVE